MFTLSRTTDYALVALARLAQQHVDNGEPMSARQLSDEYGLPLQSLMTILKQLHRAGILNSRQGVHGGYLLAAPPKAIRLVDVVEAIEGPAKMTLCCEEDEEDACTACRVMVKCPITVPIRRLNDRINALLEQVTLADLMESEVDVTAVAVTRSPAVGNLQKASTTSTETSIR
jgi:Rrf2 family protein